MDEDEDEDHKFEQLHQVLENMILDICNLDQFVVPMSHQGSTLCSVLLE